MNRSSLSNRLDQSFLALVLALGAACSTPPDSGEGDNAAISSPIIGGALASDHPEAALITMTHGGISSLCSGAVIAPRVVLTAGHCVAGMDSWTVTAPFVSARPVRGVGEVLDYVDDGTRTVHPGQHDIGLVYLDEPILLDQYPVLAAQPVADGSTVVNIGRILDGQLSTAALFVSPPVPVASAASQGFPFDYVARLMIEPGDSGGPVEVPGASPHLIVAVNSGAGGAEALARVDLVKDWIDQRIAVHGGPGPFVAPPAPPPAAVDLEPGRPCGALGSPASGALGAGGQDQGGEMAGADPGTARFTTPRGKVDRLPTR